MTNKNKVPSLITISLLITALSSFAAPEIFTQYLPVDSFVRGSSGMVVPPNTLEKYISVVEKAAANDPEWFQEHSKKSTVGIPLPYHEKLGLTKKQYKGYLTEWGKRSFQEVKPVALKLEKVDHEDWMISATGPGFAISALRYNLEKKELRSPNGTFKRIEDIKGHPDSLLGAWTGQEWLHESETTISKTRENFAIGKQTGANAGYIIYRLQEISNTGRKLYDRRITIEFPITKKK